MSLGKDDQVHLAESEASCDSSSMISQGSFSSFPARLDFGSKGHLPQEFVDFTIDMDVEWDQSYSSAISGVNMTWNMV